jgi:ATP synthase protein I
MSDGEGNPKPAHRPGDAELSGRLKDLSRRIEANRAASSHDDVAAAAAGPAKTGYGMAMRMGADFVAGVLVGAVLGWGLDRLLGTSPWGLAVFLLLGFAAGILNLLRTAGAVRPFSPGGAPPPAAKIDEED